jgi:hypothetical protein
MVFDQERYIDAYLDHEEKAARQRDTVRLAKAIYPTGWGNGEMGTTSLHWAHIGMDALKEIHKYARSGKRDTF